MGRRWLLLFVVILGLPSMLCAQTYTQFPGFRVMPKYTKENLQQLGQDRLASLELYSDYLKQRVEDGAIEEGVYLHIEAVRFQAIFAASDKPEEKREHLEKLLELQKKRIELDRNAGFHTWFGVDRMRLGNYLRLEQERFIQQYPKKVAQTIDTDDQQQR